RTEAQLRTPRSNRRQQHVGPRGDEDEHRRRRRLLERLQQRVLRLHDERVCFVDDDDAAPSLERPVVGALDDVADLIDLDRAAVARLDDNDVRMHAARDTAARGALAARIELRTRTRTRTRTLNPEL